MYGMAGVMVMGLMGLEKAQSLALPSIPEATDAIVEMFSGAGIARPSKVQLGTCIPAMDAKYPGQAACTVAVALGAAITETQVDFYKKARSGPVHPKTSCPFRTLS